MRFLAVVVALVFFAAQANAQPKVVCKDGKCQLQTSAGNTTCPVGGSCVGCGPCNGSACAATCSNGQCNITYNVAGKQYSESEYIKTFNITHINGKPVGQTYQPIFVAQSVWTEKPRPWHK